MNPTIPERGTLRRLEDLLATLTLLGRAEIERLDLEIKSAAPLESKGDYAEALAKAALALANFGGGFIVVGYQRPDDSKYEEEVLSSDLLQTWEQTRINQMLQEFSEPPLSCTLFMPQGPKSFHPVLEIAGHGVVPHICRKDGSNLRRGALYCRVPGPRSEEPRDPIQWSEIIRRCTLHDREILVRAMQGVLLPPARRSPDPDEKLKQWIGEAERRFAEFVRQQPENLPTTPWGRWAIAYHVSPVPAPVSLRELHTHLESAIVRATGWPIGVVMTRPEIAPQVGDGFIESWIADRALPSLDYWFARPEGFFYATRGYEEDFEWQPGQRAFEWMAPIWRVGEGLLHASRFCRHLAGDDGRIRFWLRYDDLHGRHLFNLRRNILGPHHTYTTRSKHWEGTIEFGTAEAESQLPRLLQTLLDPLYERFDLFEMPADVYRRETDELRQRVR